MQDGSAQGIEVHAGPERGGHRVGGAQFGGGVAGGGAEHPAFALLGGHLQVDQPQLPVRGDHDVVGVEVVQREAEFVGGGDQFEQLPDQGVSGRLIGTGGSLPDQPLGHRPAQGRSRYRLGDQEGAALLLEYLHEPGNPVGELLAEALQQSRLPAQQVPYVQPFEAGAHMRTGLLDDDLGAGGGVLRPEHTTLVGVLDRAAYEVALVQQHGLRGGRAAGRSGRAARERVSRPGRRAVPGVALVGDRPALGIGQPGGEGAVGRELEGPREHAVAVVDLTVRQIAPVGEHRGTGQPHGGPVQLLCEQPELCVVDRVDRDELAGPSPGEAPRDQGGDPRGTRRELERRPVGGQHLGGSGQHHWGRERGGRDVELPPLGTADGIPRPYVAPELARFHGPVPRCSGPAGPGPHEDGAHQVG